MAMTIPLEVEIAITHAATLAASVFRTFGWTWGDETRPPTMREIESKYRRMVDDCGALVQRGMSGRLTVRRVGGHWEFGIELAFADEDALEDSGGDGPARRIGRCRSTA